VNLCVVRPNETANMETFIRAHLDGLPAKVSLIEGGFPRINGRPVRSQTISARVCRKMWRSLCGQDWNGELTSHYVKAFRQLQTEVVLAEYGPTGVRVLDACQRLRIPLVVHFHGYDASVRSVLAEHAESYRRLFREAAAIVAVSRQMCDKLISLGAASDKVHYNPYGVDCRAFSVADSMAAAPVFLAVGRFVEKKAPQRTLSAFAEVYRANPATRLRMIGDGPLLSSCRELARELGINRAVTFLGEQTSLVIQDEMRHARCFVQHSVEAGDGDCEGAPVAVIEAGASGLPVVATRHGGIPDIVLDEETGFLVNEHDARGMAAQMLRVITDAALAARIGQAARKRIVANFSKELRLARLWSIIERSVQLTSKTSLIGVVETADLALGGCGR
jgi:glycosyltransferase involved in cell wall biosynthesis